MQKVDHLTGLLTRETLRLHIQSDTGVSGYRKRFLCLAIDHDTQSDIQRLADWVHHTQKNRRAYLYGADEILVELEADGLPDQPPTQYSLVEIEISRSSNPQRGVEIQLERGFFEARLEGNHIGYSYDGTPTEQKRDSLLEAIFNSALDPLLLTDQSARYVDANAAACELYGLTRAQLIGRSIADFTGSEIVNEETYRHFREQGAQRGQCIITRPDGMQKIVEYSAVSQVAPGLDLSILRDVTERVAAEEGLRRNEELFRAVLEKSSEVISLTASDGTTRYLTPSAYQILGWTAEELGNQTLRQQVIPEDQIRIEAELARLVSTGARDMSLEFRVRHRDGTLRWIESTGTNRLDDPNVRAIVGNYRDITARKRVEEALRASRDLLEEAQAIAHVGSWMSGFGAQAEVEWSLECYRIFGIEPGTPMTFASFYELVHPDDRERTQQTVRTALLEASEVSFEHRVLRPDGRICYVQERGKIERDTSGKAIRMIGTVQDISQSRLSSEALSKSEERYRRIVESTSDGIFLYDANTQITFVNARLGEVLGYSSEELLGQSFYAFLGGAEREEARSRMNRRRQGLSDRSDFRFRRKDGTEIWASVEGSALFSPAGVFEGGLVVVTDVTAQRIAGESRARLAAIVESAEDAMASLDLERRILSWNAGAEKLYGYTAEEMVGQIRDDSVPADREQELHDALKAVESGGAVARLETLRMRKDGVPVEVSVSMAAIKDSTGKIVGTSVITRDLSERRRSEAALRRAEDELRQAQKMEAIGYLAGGVAHDFNNLLSVILSYTCLLLDQVGNDSSLRSDLEEVQQAGIRAAELTRQLLAFSRRQVLAPSVLALDQVILGMTKMLTSLLGESVKLSILRPRELGRIHADQGQLEQVIMNLVVNARDAMPEGGTVTIETRNVECAEAKGPCVLLKVADTGKGMTPETLSRMFEPFYTTKEKGKGTGLGLSTVHGIVHQSGGHIAVRSEPGKGTTFEIYLPRTDLALPEQLASNQALKTSGGHETILVVEDEAQVRAVSCSVLRKHGYHILEAPDGAHALRLCAEFEGQIDLLFTDVVMPGMSGRELADRLLPLRPNMKVLYASGYTEDSIIHHGVIDSSIAFLAKPLTPATLLSKIREVLDEAAPSRRELPPISG